MKTNQVMIREMGVFSVLQRTSDGYFNATELLKQWNNTMTDKVRLLDNFWKSTNLSDLMSEIAENELNFKSVDFTELKNILSSTRRGKFNGGTWMHPILFIKFAMYLDARFEYHVLKFISDQMLQYRNDSGDAYKKLCSSVLKSGKPDDMKNKIQNIAKALNYIVFGEHLSMARNKFGDETKQRELLKLEIKLSELIDDGFINTYDQLISYMRKLWNNKYQPKELN